MARTPDLSEGDLVEYSQTVNFKPEKEVEVWMKAGGQTTVREKESGSKAFDRLANFVERKLQERIDDWYEEEEEKKTP